MSAESMNAAALQMQYKKMVYEKTAACATLNDILKENFLFKGLDGDQMTTLLDAMFMANFEAGKAIIEQGAEGDASTSSSRASARSSSARAATRRWCSPAARATRSASSR